MTNEELVAAVRREAREQGVEVEEDEISVVLGALADEVGAELEEEGVVEVPGLGTFELRRRGGRVGMDPKREGDTIGVAATDWVQFEAGDRLVGSDEHAQK